MLPEEFLTFALSLLISVFKNDASSMRLQLAPDLRHNSLQHASIRVSFYDLYGKGFFLRELIRVLIALWLQNRE